MKSISSCKYKILSNRDQMKHCNKSKTTFASKFSNDYSRKILTNTESMQIKYNLRIEKFSIDLNLLSFSNIEFIHESY